MAIQTFRGSWVPSSWTLRAVSRQMIASGTRAQDGSEGVMLRQFGLRDAVEAARHSLDVSLVHQAPERTGMDAQFDRVAGTEEALLAEFL